MSNVLVKIWEGGVHLLWEVREKTARSFCMSVVGLWCVLVWILNQCWSTDELAVGGKDFVGEGSDICHDMRGEGRQYESCEDEPCWGEDDLKFVHWFIILGYYIGQRNPRCLCENCCWFYSEVVEKRRLDIKLYVGFLRCGDPFLWLFFRNWWRSIFRLRVLPRRSCPWLRCYSSCSSFFLRAVRFSGSFL